MANQHYYESKSSADRLLAKMKRQRQLAEDIARYQKDLRYVTGADREELEAKLSTARIQLTELKKIIV